MFLRVFRRLCSKGARRPLFVFCILIVVLTVPTSSSIRLPLTLRAQNTLSTQCTQRESILYETMIVPTVVCAVRCLSLSLEFALKPRRRGQGVISSASSATIRRRFFLYLPGPIGLSCPGPMPVYEYHGLDSCVAVVVPYACVCAPPPPPPSPLPHDIWH